MKSFEEQKLVAALFHIKFTHAMVYRSTLVYPTPDHLRRLFSNISTKRPHKRRSKCIKRGRSLEIKTLGSSPPLFFASTPAVSPSIKDHVFRIKSTSTLYWSSNRIFCSEREWSYYFQCATIYVLYRMFDHIELLDHSECFHCNKQFEKYDHNVGIGIWESPLLAAGNRTKFCHFPMTSLQYKATVFKLVKGCSDSPRYPHSLKSSYHDSLVLDLLVLPMWNGYSL